MNELQVLISGEDFVIFVNDSFSCFLIKNFFVNEHQCLGKTLLRFIDVLDKEADSYPLYEIVFFFFFFEIAFEGYLRHKSNSIHLFVPYVAFSDISFYKIRQSLCYLMRATYPDLFPKLHDLTPPRRVV